MPEHELYLAAAEHAMLIMLMQILMLPLSISCQYAAASLVITVVATTGIATTSYPLLFDSQH